MRRLREFLQHRLNPLHVYCCLVSLGFRETRARRICHAYEGLVYKRTWLSIH